MHSPLTASWPPATLLMARISPKAAKALACPLPLTLRAPGCLAEAGYPNGEGFPTLTLSYYDNDTVKKVVEAMAEMLKNNLNINVEVSSNEWSIFYDDVQKGNYQVAAMGWSADYVNPMSFLPLCKTGDSSNNLFYSNADYDALVDQVKAENDPAKLLS